MKVIRNILLVVIFILIVAFCLFIAQNFTKSGYEGRTNLVINFRNVTGSMKGEVIKENDDIYLSMDDIKNYYDNNIYLDTKYNYIVAAGNGNIVCFDIKNENAKYNNDIVKAKVIQKDGMYYIPVKMLEKIYNISVEYNDKTNIVVLDSKDKALKQATTKKKVSVKSKSSILSKTLEEIDAGDIVYVRENNDKDNVASTVKEEASFKDKVKNFFKNLDKENTKKWTFVRTKNGTTGYISNGDLNEATVARAEKKSEKPTVSMVWDYYEYTIATPNNDSNTSYKGINVVSPAFFFVDENGNIKENIGEQGVRYIVWAKMKGYKIWPMVKCDNLLSDNMRDMLSDYKKREKLIDQIAELCEKYQVDGVNIDMENINMSDKDYFSRFIIELKPRLESKNRSVSVDVTAPDGSPNWSLCYDRKTIGNVADYIVFMAYDQTSKKSQNIASNASYAWVEGNIKKFIKNNEVPANKIIVAMPLYSRIWKIKPDGTSEGAFDVNMKDQYKYINKATKSQWLETEKQNYIEFEEKGFTYKMWVEDEKSIGAKMDLLKQYGLGGVAFWEKGCEIETVWDTVENKLK